MEVVLNAIDERVRCSDLCSKSRVATSGEAFWVHFFDFVKGCEFVLDIIIHAEAIGNTLNTSRGRDDSVFSYPG